MVIIHEKVNLQFSRTKPVAGQFVTSPLPPPCYIPVSPLTPGPDRKQIIKKKVLGCQNKTAFAEKKLAALEKAKWELQRGVHTSIFAAAKANSTAEMKIAKTTLFDYIKASPGKAFRATRGKTSKLLTPDQEHKVVTFMRKRAELGCGLNFRQAI